MKKKFILLLIAIFFASFNFGCGQNSLKVKKPDLTQKNTQSFNHKKTIKTTTTNKKAIDHSNTEVIFSQLSNHHQKSSNKSQDQAIKTLESIKDTGICKNIIKNIYRFLGSNVFYPHNELNLSLQATHNFLATILILLNEQIDFFSLKDLDYLKKNYAQLVMTSLKQKNCDGFIELSKFLSKKIKTTQSSMVEPFIAMFQNISNNDLMNLIYATNAINIKTMGLKDQKTTNLIIKSDIQFLLKKSFDEQVKISAEPFKSIFAISKDMLKKRSKYYMNFVNDYAVMFPAIYFPALIKAYDPYSEIVYNPQALSIYLNKDFYSANFITLNNFDHGEVIAYLSEKKAQSTAANADDFITDNKDNIKIGQKIAAFKDPIYFNLHQHRIFFSERNYSYINQFFLTTNENDIDVTIDLEEIASNLTKDVSIKVSKRRLSDISGLNSAIIKKSNVVLGYILLDRFINDKKSIYNTFNQLKSHIDRLIELGMQVLVIDVSRAMHNKFEFGFLSASDCVKLFVSKPKSNFYKKSFYDKNQNKLINNSIKPDNLDKKQSLNFSTASKTQNHSQNTDYFDDLKIVIHTSSLTEGAAEYFVNELQSSNKALVVGSSYTKGRSYILEPTYLTAKANKKDPDNYYALIPTRVVYSSNSANYLNTGVKADIAINSNLYYLSLTDHQNHDIKSKYSSIYNLDNIIKNKNLKLESSNITDNDQSLAKNQATNLQKELISNLKNISNNRVKNNKIFNLTDNFLANLQKGEFLDISDYFMYLFKVSSEEFDLSKYQAFKDDQNDENELNARNINTHLIKSFFKAYNLRQRILYSKDSFSIKLNQLKNHQQSQKTHLTELLKADPSLAETFNIAIDYHYLQRAQLR